MPFQQEMFKKASEVFKGFTREVSEYRSRDAIMAGDDRVFRERILCFISYGFVSCRGGSVGC